jgi:glycerol dehydrogenase
MNVKRAGILASGRGLGAQGAQVAKSLKAESIESVNAQFNGECSLSEIATQVSELEDQKLDCLIAVGGGKVLDAGKCIAHRLDVPVVVVPTLASTDAPCSALSLVYTPEGRIIDVEFFPQNPEMIVVDTDVVADADEHLRTHAVRTWRGRCRSRARQQE